MIQKNLVVIAILAGLAACGQKSEPKPAPSASAGPVAPGTMVKGIGTVTAVDTAAGTVTLDHEAIPAAGWPAMTMAFKAPASIVANAKPGDKVAFDLRIEAMGGEIVDMKAQ